MKQANTSEVVLFQYDNADVRTLLIHGEPWFVLADLCKVLGLARRPGQIPERLDEGVRQAYTLQTAGGPQQMTIVSESGMYEVVIRSDKPEAAAFRRWITSEVLPSIRKTGGYSVQPALTEDELIHRALEVSARRVAQLTERVAKLEPKADLADTFLVAQGGARLVREVAKLFGMKERDLRRFLVEEGLLFTKHAECGDIQYDHYAEHAHHFRARETLVKHTWGTCTHYTVDVLPRGVELIRKRIKEATPPAPAA
ncbi:phage antirepressor [Nocardia farcinica]|uniref:phage antirepressor n=2 Tax=Nocardia farcinica TaxID=37329 RepID=UPI002004CD4B|nr:phage antirepressor KilAC domain-containing protein [Nocardia farcinica]